jgi:hypothetical protein
MRIKEGGEEDNGEVCVHSVAGGRNHTVMEWIVYTCFRRTDG